MLGRGGLPGACMHCSAAPEVFPGTACSTACQHRLCILPLPAPPCSPQNWFACQVGQHCTNGQIIKLTCNA